MRSWTRSVRITMALVASLGAQALTITAVQAAGCSCPARRPLCTCERISTAKPGDAKDERRTRGRGGKGSTRPKDSDSKTKQ